jgi:DNA-binding beta-propeller fold protein YncE
LKAYLKTALIIFMVLILVTGCFNKKPVDSIQPGTDSSQEKPRGDSEIQQDNPGALNTPPQQLAANMVIRGIKDDSLGLPVAVCQDKDGNTYVLDLYSTDGIVKVFDYQGKYRMKMAPLQAPESQPVDVAVDGQGDVYVADLGMRAVFRYGHEKPEEKIQPQEDFYPRSVAVDSRGNLLVLSFDRVYKFSPDGRVSSFGESGDGQGQFGAAGSEFYTGPSGIDVDEYDNIYVADTLNNRIQKFSPDGKFIKAYPLRDTDSPQDVVVEAGGNIFTVTSSGNLIELNSEGKVLKTTELQESSRDGWGFVGIAGGRENTLLMVAAGRHQVKVFSKDREVYSIKGDMSGGFIYPHNIAVNEDNVVIIGGDPFSSDDLNNRVMMFDKKGTLVSEIFSGYSGGRFFGPRDAVFLKDRLYLLDLDMISVFDKTGDFITSFGGRGENPGDFGVYDNYGQEQGPAGIAAGADAELIISDTYNDRIQKITIEGKYAGGFDVSSPGPITSDRDGNIYTVLPGEARVVKFSPEGKKLLEFGKPGMGDGEFFLENGEGDLQGPDGIAVDDQKGLIYVSDTAAHRIEIFDSQGNYVKSIGGFGTGENGFYYPRSLALDREGFLWVADSGNHRVVRLNVR